MVYIFIDDCDDRTIAFAITVAVTFFITLIVTALVTPLALPFCVTNTSTSKLTRPKF